MYLDEHKLLWISSLIALLQWTLVNIGEHWWTLVSTDEHWWALVNTDEHCEQWRPLGILLLLIVPLQSLSWPVATSLLSSSSSSSTFFHRCHHYVGRLLLFVLLLHWTVALHTHTEYSLLIQSQDEYYQNGSRQAQFDYLTQQPWIGQVSDVFRYKTWRQIFMPILHPNWRLGQRRRKNSKEIQQRLRRNSFCGDEGKVNIFDLKVIVISLPQTSQHIKLIWSYGAISLRHTATVSQKTQK